MDLRLFFAIFLSLVFSLDAAPIVSSVRAEQRPGTGLVDIFYDLNSDNGEAFVLIEISNDGGLTYTSEASSVSGNVGGAQTSGTDLHIIWEAVLDMPEIRSDTMRIKLTASKFEDSSPMVEIDAGSFQMGDNLDGSSNAPLHAVFLSGYKIGETETTVEQWEEVLHWASKNGYTDLNREWNTTEGIPVVTSWYMAVKWCNAASEKAGLEPVYYSTNEESSEVYRVGTLEPFIDYTKNGYRLPTEAEWERAARGGISGQRFPWGNTISHENANYRANGSIPYDSSIYTTDTFHPDVLVSVSGTPYGNELSLAYAFSPNGFGLYGLAGNVAEWCADWYGADYYVNSPQNNPTGPTIGSKRVLRGGAYGTRANLCSVAYRYYTQPSSLGVSGNLRADNAGSGYAKFGFRVARNK